MRVATALLLMFLPAVALAQTDAQTEPGLAERVAELEKRVERLEQENRALRAAISSQKSQRWAKQLKDGLRADVVSGDRKLAELVIDREGWGQSRPEDVAAVAVSVARTIFSALPPVDRPTILLIRANDVPRTLSQKGPAGEYIVQLATGDRLWAQLAYQFSHECGHVLCRELDERAPQHWFEEAFCEALSLWTMDQMAMSWKTAAPYESWQSYSTSLAQYVEAIRSRMERPESLPEWYATYRKLLDREPYDRPKNRIVAEHIATLGHKQPESLRAYLYLRKTPPEENTFESLLAAWHGDCPDDLQFVPREMAKLLGVTLPVPAEN